MALRVKVFYLINVLVPLCWSGLMTHISGVYVPPLERSISTIISPERCKIAYSIELRWRNPSIDSSTPRSLRAVVLHQSPELFY